MMAVEGFLGSMGGLRSTFMVVWLISLQLCSLIKGHGGDDDNAEGEKVDLHSKSLMLVKVWCLIILLISTFAGGVSPYFLRWNEAFLLLGTQFAGGVFLGTSLMHFLSDSNDTFSSLTTKTYPFSFMLACVGYLLTMLGDCIVLFVTGNKDREARVVELQEEGKTPQEMGMEANPVFVKTSNVGDTILLILALCFHSVFEGIAVGVSGSKGEAWRNLWTISLHKVFAAIAMGIALLRMIPKRPLVTTVVYSFAFAISSPIGVGIGIAIDATTQGRTADWIYAISMGVACGVFVYVAINHLISKGFKLQTHTAFDTPWSSLIHFSSCRLSHVLREGNQVADSLAQLAMKTRCNFTVFDRCPAFASAKHFADRVGISFPRDFG